MLGVEETVLGSLREVRHRAALHLDQLIDRFVLARLRQVKAGGVSVGLAVFGEMLKAGVAVARTTRRFRIDAIKISDHHRHRIEETV